MSRLVRTAFALSVAIGLTACPGDDVPSDTTSGGSGSTGTQTSTSTTDGTATTSVATGSSGPGPDDTTTTSASTGTSTGEATGSGSSGDGTGSTDAGSSSGGDPCPPADGGAIGQDCGMGGVVCPECYTCQPFVGFVFQETCQILCDPMMGGADCPPTHPNCVETIDKTGIPWFQCSL